MWYVRGEWHGNPNCWWGAYNNKETADKLAKEVNGTVFRGEKEKTIIGTIINFIPEAVVNGM